MNSNLMLYKALRISCSVLCFVLLCNVASAQQYRKVVKGNDDQNQNLEQMDDDVKNINKLIEKYEVNEDRLVHSKENLVFWSNFLKTHKISHKRKQLVLDLMREMKEAL